MTQIADDVRTVKPCSEKLNILLVPPHLFWYKPQVGMPLVLSWAQLVANLSRPMYVAAEPASTPEEQKKAANVAKASAGGWAGGLFRDNIRQGTHHIGSDVLVFDVDGNGDVGRIAEVLSGYRFFTHETYQSTPEKPRCRAVIPLAATVDDAAYRTVHAILSGRLTRAGFLVDKCAKDPTRLCYAPVRPPGAGFRTRQGDGAPLDARALILATPPPPKPRYEAPAWMGTGERSPQYIEGACKRAYGAVGMASDGDRHHQLLYEAHSLARSELGLTLSDVERVLLPAFVSCAGEGRRTEGIRAIRDAYNARINQP